MMEYIERSMIEKALSDAIEKKRKHEKSSLSEAYIEAVTCISCFEYVLSLCRPIKETENEIKPKDMPS